VAAPVGRQVHDVGVALNGHQPLDGNTARPAHPAQVVACEVDEHPVLGQLLDRRPQVILGELVGVAVVAARPGAGERADQRLAAVQRQARFRWGPTTSNRGPACQMW
jgi:hypothetical protein